MPRLNSPAELEKLRQSILSKRDPNKPCIAICAGTGCLALGCNKVIAAFKEEVKKQGLEASVDLRETGCPGFCEKGTVVVVYPEGICYLQVTPKDVPEIISQTVIEKKVIDRLLYTDPNTGEKAVHESEIPFYKHQKRSLIGNNSKIDPRSIEDYIALGGYSALAKALFQSFLSYLHLGRVLCANLTHYKIVIQRVASIQEAHLLCWGHYLKEQSQRDYCL